MAILESILSGAFGPGTFPYIVCRDGARLSVQAGDGWKSSSRHPPYTHVEVGYPDPAPPAFWSEYADHYEEDGQVIFTGVYLHVPVGLVQAYIEWHGGEI